MIEIGKHRHGEPHPLRILRVHPQVGVIPNPLDAVTTTPCGPLLIKREYRRRLREHRSGDGREESILRTNGYLVILGQVVLKVLRDEEQFILG